MSGEICLQGGAEFRPGCEPMDRAMLTGPGDGSTGPARRVLVAPFAAAPGRERQVAGDNAARWYRGLGATEVAVSLTEDTLLPALSQADLLVLPGGSPARLLRALIPFRTALLEACEAGLAVSGASAGAMVLCRFTVLPGRHPETVPGLALAPVDLVLPHFRGDTRWLDAARSVLPDGASVLGLPERSGVIIGNEGPRPVGVEPVVELSR